MNGQEEEELCERLDEALAEARTGETREAILKLQVLSREAPGFISVWGHLGYLLILSGKASEALDCYHEILKRDPANEEAKFRMAECHQVLGNLREAHRLYDSLSREAPESTLDLAARRAATLPILSRVTRRVPRIVSAVLKKSLSPGFLKGVCGEILSLPNSRVGIQHSGVSAYLTYLNQHYLDGEWFRFPKSSCDLCGGRKFRATYFYAHQKSVRCLSCGLEAVERKPPDSMDVLYGHYELESTVEHFESMWNDPSQFGARTERIQELFAGCSLPFPIKGENAFEFGCGQGHLLNWLREGGMEVAGLETSVRLVGDCERLFGVQAEYGTVAQYKPAESEFDLVLGFHMLEHLDRPSMLFEKARKMLKPGGYLLLEVPIPNLEACTPIQKLDGTYGYGNLGHLYYFTKETLPSYYEKFGFEVVGSYAYAEEGLGSGGFLGRLEN